MISFKTFVGASVNEESRGEGGILEASEGSGILIRLDEWYQVFFDLVHRGRTERPGARTVGDEKCYKGDVTERKTRRFTGDKWTPGNVTDEGGGLNDTMV